MMGIRLTINRFDGFDDWFVIERAEHDGRRWYEATDHGRVFMKSSRFSVNADVEGTSAEMLDIAGAIRSRSGVCYKRCAVLVDGQRVLFWSPRNSETPGETSLEHADELARQIEACWEVRREIVRVHPFAVHRLL